MGGAGAAWGRLPRAASLGISHGQAQSGRGGQQGTVSVHAGWAVTTAPNALYSLWHCPQTCDEPLPGAHGFPFTTVTVLWRSEVVHIT